MKADLHRMGPWGKLLSYLLAGVLIHSDGHAQEWNIKTYTTKDGLSSSYIWSISRDSLGYLWLGTPNGLDRFDGKNFVNYGVAEGLPDSRATAMFTGGGSSRWVSTVRGVAELKGGRFVSYPLADSARIRSASIIRTSNGATWALTNAGIYEFRDRKWWKLKLCPGYENTHCRGLIEAGEGMYIDYGNTLVWLRPDHTCTEIAPYQKLDYYYLNLQRHSGEIFASTVDGLYSIKNGRFQRMPGVLGRLKGLYCFFRDSQRRFWIGDEQGLRMVATGDTGVFHPIYRQSGVNLISCITEDGHGNIWVADYNGLVRITEARYRVVSAPQIVDSPSIRNIIQPPHQPLYIVNGSLRVQEHRASGWTAKQLRLGRGPELPNHEMIVDNYAFDDKGRTWYYLRGFSLAMQKGDTVYGQQGLLDATGGEAFDVLFDTYRKKLLVAVRKQPAPCQYDSGRLSPLSFRNRLQINGNILKLHQCADQTLVFATDSGAIYSLDKDNICKLQLSEFDHNGAVSWWLDDPSGDLWIVYSGRGLRRYGWKGGSLQFKEGMTGNDHLGSDYIVHCCFDDAGNLWLCTARAVTVFSKDRASGRYKGFISFNVSDLGVENNESSRLVKDSTGNIWLATTQRLVCFYPDKIMVSLSPIPGVQIERVRLDIEAPERSKFTVSDRSLFPLPDHPALPYNKDAISIYFTGVLISGTEGMRYSYQLQGLDTGWSQESAENSVSFAHLSPGNYHFQVRARLPNTGWSNPAEFSFLIKKPYWETWWFRLVVVLFATSNIVIIFSYRMSQLKQSTAMKNQLHELEMKALKLQLNPHFIHNALNSIQSLVMHHQNHEASRYINKFANLLRQVFENSERNLVPLEKELYSLDLYVDLENLRMNRPVSYSVVLTDPVFGAGLKIPPLILQPFVENALWHGLSRKEGVKTLVLEIELRQDWLIFSITDNGVGRKKAEQQRGAFPEGNFSKAVPIIRQRLDDFNRLPGVEPISFFDLEEGGRPKGTRVVIRVRAS